MARPRNAHRSAIARLPALRTMCLRSMVDLN
jgi:hypothetical protein